jgi:hypothetical protein
MEHDSYIAENPAPPSKPRPILRRPLVWIIAAVPLVIAATVSWFMAGNDTWGMISLGAVVLGMLISAGAFRAAVAAPMQSSSWLAFGIVVGYVALLLAAWIAPGAYFPLSEVRVTPHKDGPDGRTRVAYRGGLVGEFEGTNEFRFTIRGHFNAASLTVETWGPDGWMRRPFQDFLGAELEKVPTTCLYVDNRDHAAVQLECGELRLDIPANSNKTHVFMAANTLKSATLRIDGEVIGRLDAGFFLVDVRGTRTYVQEEVLYMGGLSAIAILGNKQPPAEKEPYIAHLSGRRLHPLQRQIDFFLQRAPERITVRTFGMIAQDESRVQLVERR